MKAVVLLSGGIDSTTSLAIAKKEGFEIYALSFDYGQRHRIELGSARRVASVFNAKRHLIVRFDLREIGGSALTSEIEVPKTTPLNPPLLRGELKGGIPLTYVPARNTIFLSFALAWAEVLGAEDIFIGANSLDYSGYPDCRPEYLEAFEKMANLATKASIEGKSHYNIRSPLVMMTKAEIIKKGMELGVDYGLTWSCYDPQPASNSQLRTPNSELIPCGECDSCQFRKKGFHESGMEDPLIKR